MASLTLRKKQKASAKRRLSAFLMCNVECGMFFHPTSHISNYFLIALMAEDLVFTRYMP